MFSKGFAKSAGKQIWTGEASPQVEARDGRDQSLTAPLLTSEFKVEIRKIEIENFRSIKDKINIYFDKPKYIAFIGPNNVGKSNVLRAINFFFNKEVEYHQNFSPTQDLFLNFKKSGTIFLELQFKNKSMQTFIDKSYKSEFRDYIVPITLVYHANGNFQYSFTNIRGQKKNLPDLIDRILESVNCVYIPAIKDYKNIINKEMMRKIVSATFQGWGRGIGISRKIGEHKEKFQKTLRELQNFLNTSGDYISDLFNSAMPNIKRFDFSLPYADLEDFLGKLIFEISEEGLSEKVLLDNEGSGIQSYTIYSMLKLLHELRNRKAVRKSKFIWLIEEPETFMHHDLQRKTFDKLKQYSSDGYIFTTTHSPIFIDKKEDYKNCYHVVKNSNSTKLSTVTTKTIREIISGSLGISFNDFFMFNKFNILVEGDSDKILLLELNKLFEKKGCNDVLDIKDVEFISCRSANSIGHFYLMYNSFNQYANFFALFDRDEAGNKVRADLSKNGIADKFLLQVPLSSYKADTEIEDLVDKDIWDDCLKKIDDKGLITLKTSKGDIIGYECKYRKDLSEVKKNFCELLVDHAKKDLSKFSKYHELLRSFRSLCDAS